MDVKRVRLVVAQPNNVIYFDKSYKSVMMAMDKFHYFSKLAHLNYRDAPQMVLKQTETEGEMSLYFPHNDGNIKNQSGFIRVSLYFES